ncbi:TolC family protein [Moraxella boevrei]|uniref:TolC family protein n=1 Tax=Faucicola boevrei TaxID=346665 RepID=UPI003736C2BF
MVVASLRICKTRVIKNLPKSLVVFSLAVLPLAVHSANMTDVNGLIGQAVATHPLVGSARAEEQATAEGVRAAKLNLLPQPSVTSSYDKNDGMISRAGLRQPLWTGGRLTANVNQAIYDDKAAMAYIFEQQNTVAKNTIDIWQSYIYAVALQQLYVNNLKQLGEFEAMMQRRVSEGVSAKIDLELVKNRILQDQNAYQGAVQQQRIAEARLSQMIGENVNGQAVGTVTLAKMAQYVKAQSVDFEQLAFNQSGINNPSVIKQQFQIEAAKQGVKAQQASRYPTVYAQYEYLYYHKGTRDNDGQFSVGLSYDPGAGFSNMALARASQARVQSLEQSQEAARRTVMESIQTQYQEFVNAKDQETSLISAVAGAQIVVDSYRRQFIAGRKSWLEVLNAVREKAGYEQQLLQIQSQMLGAYYKLAVDFGRMPWQEFGLIHAPTQEYRPYQSLQDWLQQHRDDTLQSSNTLPTSNRIDKGFDNIFDKDAKNNVTEPTQSIDEALVTTDNLANPKNATDNSIHNATSDVTPLVDNSQVLITDSNGTQKPYFPPLQVPDIKVLSNSQTLNANQLGYVEP